ncbi:unnamed protein product [Acanthoscelides obtectus]|uniref:Uncharacterized protein n=1 Tax=Acanthoscelides obtectus TaxID=200917 RepID=A0A9P0Q941_ACAOB|nr:unnamed protein product [Acanthoscelides obtectus]CAK1670602.1 Inward rectifier potassium channel 2 [Acanthoscelides obtectus]
MMDRITWVANKTLDLRRKPYGLFIRDTKLKRRAILKNGEYNVLQPKFPNRYWNYLRDPYTSLVDAEWKWNLQAMAIGFLGCWLTFALLWWLIAFVHTDLQDDHLPDRQGETGTIIDSFTVGAVIAKLTRPTMSNNTIMFTRNAVICLMDGVLCLMFRLGDLRKRKLIGVSISAILIRTKRTREGERLDNYETPLELQCDDMGSDIFFLWPMTVVHKIDADSPFYNLSASQMLNENFEIVVTLEGSIESTGQGTNAKTSYLSCEILWGQKFVNLVSFNEKHQSYEADFKLFDKMEWVETPFCSAAEYEAQGNEENNTKTTEGNSITYTDSTKKEKEDTLQCNGVAEDTVAKHGNEFEEHELSKAHQESGDWEYGKQRIPVYQDVIYEEDECEDSDERADTPPFPVTWV